MVSRTSGSRPSIPRSNGSSSAGSSTSKAPSAGAPRRSRSRRPRPANWRASTRVRDALREVADSIAEQRAPTAEALDTVNRALHARQVIELIPAPDGVNVDHRHVGDPIDDALARLADPLVKELTAGHPDRIRICDNDTCRWVFYDTSRTGRRRWCSMATCGNQAKAARHRARAKQAASGATAPDVDVTASPGRSSPVAS